MTNELLGLSATERLLVAADALVQADGGGGSALAEAEMELLAAARGVGRIEASQP